MTNEGHVHTSLDIFYPDEGGRGIKLALLESGFKTTLGAFRCNDRDDHENAKKTIG